MGGSFRAGGEDIRVGADIWVAVLGREARIFGFGWGGDIFS